MKKYTADFETSTLEWYKIDGYARVWAWALCEIGNPDNFIYGEDLDSFMETLEKSRDNFTLYFHNLKFDGEYIFWWLEDHGYTYIENKKEAKDHTYTCLITDTGQFYSIEIWFSIKGTHVKKVTIYDSLKILNFSVEYIASKKGFNLPIQKLELDYDYYRPKGHHLTEHEVDYIRNDVEVMSRALKIMFDRKLTKMTIASNALSYYKTTIDDFKYFFPVLTQEQDEIIRKSYKGGWTYLNPYYKEKIVEDGIVIDKNSMYPAMMYDKFLPCGNPEFYNGEYKEDKTYPLYIQSLTCSFKVKPGKLPTIQLKHNPAYRENEYIEDTEGKLETLTLTNVDLELFLEHYDVKDLTYNCGFKFRQVKGMFKKYIDFWINEKITGQKEGSVARRTIAKLMLNSLYGKFGTNGLFRSKRPDLKPDKSVGYKLNKSEIKDTIYCPVASFITSYARADIIRNSQAVRDYSIATYGEDYYIYSDTDSIHCKKLSIEELSKIMDIDDYKLGAYKVESTFIKGKFIRQKCYVEVAEDGKVNSTIAGCPKKLSKYINLDNFKVGFSIAANDPNYEDKKLTFKHVKGGVILVPTDFTIKP